MSYVRPEDVRSPKAFWHLVAVLLDQGPDGCAFALGTWDGEPRIGFRWNGNDENPIGNPQSRGLPTWTMLDPELHEVVAALLSKEKQPLARSFLGIGLMFEGVTLSSDSQFVVLLDFGANPPVVVKVACGAIRQVTNRPDLTAEDCRLLADRNKHLVAEAAAPMLAENRYTFSEDGRLRFIEVDAQRLAGLATPSSMSVLQVATLARKLQSGHLGSGRA